MDVVGAPGIPIVPGAGGGVVVEDGVILAHAGESRDGSIVRLAAVPMAVAGRGAVGPGPYAFVGGVGEADPEAGGRPESGAHPLLFGRVVDGDQVTALRDGFGLGRVPIAASPGGNDRVPVPGRAVVIPGSEGIASAQLGVHAGRAGLDRFGIEYRVGSEA